MRVRTVGLTVEYDLKGNAGDELPGKSASATEEGKHG